MNPYRDLGGQTFSEFLPAILSMSPALDGIAISQRKHDNFRPEAWNCQ
jgi:hypothetical protein